MDAPPSAPAPPRRFANPRGGRRRRALPETPAGEPWLGDHRWRRDGAEDLAPAEGRGALVVGGVLTVVGSAFAAALLPEVDWPFVLAPALFGGGLLVGGLWLLARGVRAVQRRARHGVSELRFARFPFLLGEPLDATLVREGATARLEGLVARLSCVQERREPGTGVSGEPFEFDSYAREVTWSETRPLPGAVGTRAALRLPLPPPGPGVAGTALAGDPPRYWELELWAPGEGGRAPYLAVFLLPVYERPGAPGAAGRP